MLLQEPDPASGVFLALGPLFPELLPPLIGLGGGGAYFAREFLTSFVLLSFVSVCVCVCELIPRKRKTAKRPGIDCSHMREHFRNPCMFGNGNTIRSIYSLIIVRCWRLHILFVLFHVDKLHELRKYSRNGRTCTQAMNTRLFLSSYPA